MCETVRQRSFADIYRRHAGIPSHGLQLRTGLRRTLVLRRVSSTRRFHATETSLAYRAVWDVLDAVNSSPALALDFQV